jgi:hypothetical protein
VKKMDPISEEIIGEFKEQNEKMRQQITDMDVQMKILLNLVNDIHSKINSDDYSVL